MRRFFCEESTCRRKIFAERFPSLRLPRAKFTLRLQEVLRERGFELGGEAGSRLGKKLSYPGSPDTILRLVERAELPVLAALWYPFIKFGISKRESDFRSGWCLPAILFT